MKLFLNKKILLGLSSFLAISFFANTVFAVWNGTFYEPGDTLNPECLPSDPDCDVRSPLTILNIDDTVYGVSWDADTTHAPSKNAVYDALNALPAGHDAVTLGTANGLSLSTQQLSLALASTSTTGALSDTDWDTFNNKQNALTADIDYLTPGTATSTYEPIKGIDDNYVTDAEKIVIGNTSGTNTGDNAVNTLYSGLISSQWTTTGNDIYYNTGKVGIGIATPGELLSLGSPGTTKGVISLAGNTSGKIIIQPADAAGTYTLTLPTTLGAAGSVLTDVAGNGVLSWAAPGGGSSQWTTTGSDIYYNTGKVGIGTTNPTRKFEVSFAENTHNTPQVVFTNTGSGNASNVLVNSTTSNPAIAFGINNVAKGNFGWNSSTNSLTLINLVYGTNDSSIFLNSDGSFEFKDPNNGAITRFKALANGYFGIGTDTPNNLIQVNDLITFTNADFRTQIGYQAGKYDLGQNNTWIGYQAGSSNNATGKTNAADNNTAVGYLSLQKNTTGSGNSAQGAYSLFNNTTGNSNIAQGYCALCFNTTGTGNIAHGYNALGQNIGGSYNVAQGYESLSSNSTGIGNVAQGYFSLAGNTTGNHNSAVGSEAGRWIADGITANSTGSSSLFLGKGTRALAGGQTNQIVIGNDAIGLGSNSVVLGNDSITTTALKGKVGIGDTNPTSDLVISSGGTISGTELKFRYSNSYGDTRLLSHFDSNAQSPNYLAFLINQTNGIGTEQMRIVANGNVGIGTNNPDAKLDVVSQYSSIKLYEGNPGNPSTSYPYLALSNNSSSNKGGVLRFQKNGANLWGFGSDYLADDSQNFWIYDYVASAPRLLINSAGSVGIGTTTPGELLSLGLAGTTKGVISLAGNTSGKIIIQPADAAGTYTLTLPTALGAAGSVLTDVAGDGVLSWAAPGAGSQTPWTSNINAAGYTLFGNNTASGNLTLDSTSNATKGFVLINPTGGNVGIGTTTPATKLTIASDNGTALGYGDGLQIKLSDNVATDRPVVGFYRSRGTNALPSTISSGDVLGSFSFFGYRSGLFNAYSTIRSVYNGSGGQLEFFTSPNASGNGEVSRLTILNNGNVGIGTTSPTFRMHISSPNFSDTQTLGASSGGFNISNVSPLYGIQMGVLSTGDGWVQVGRNDGTATAYNLLLQTLGGNVGIGTTSPVSKLHIGVAPTASANFGTLSIGSGAFNGTTSGYFVGSVSGTSLAVNEVSSYAGNLLDLQVGGSSKFNVSNTGAVTATGNITSSSGSILTSASRLLGWNGRSFMSSPSGAVIQLGDVNAASPVSQTLGVQGSRGGTDIDVSGANLTIRSGLGTGAAISSNLYFATPDVTTTGSAQQTASTKMTILGNGNVGIGTTGPEALFQIFGTSNKLLLTYSTSLYGPTGGEFYSDVEGNLYINSVKNGPSVLERNILLASSGGYVGIGMTNPSVALDVTGDIEYTGTITDVSDKKLKENISDFSGALDIISSLQAKKYNMIGSDKEEVGFIAQDVKSLFPNATSVIDPENGYLGVSYVSLVPVVAEATKELNLKVESLAVAVNGENEKSFSERFFENLFTKITSWLADAGNGIASIFTNKIESKKSITETLCVKNENGETCITREQLDALLLNAITPSSAPLPDQGGSGESDPIPTPENTESGAGEPLTCTPPQVLNDTGDACIEENTAPVSGETEPTETVTEPAPEEVPPAVEEPIMEETAPEEVPPASVQE